eukprot:1176212-Prorocentrum_minimum.AAC.1
MIPACPPKSVSSPGRVSFGSPVAAHKVSPVAAHKVLWVTLKGERRWLGELLQVLHGRPGLPLLQPACGLQPLLGGHRVLAVPAHGVRPDSARQGVHHLRGGGGVRHGAEPGHNRPLPPLPAHHQPPRARRHTGDGLSPVWPAIGTSANATD